MNNFYNQIRSYVKNDEISLALEDLSAYLRDRDSRLYNEVTLHRAAFIENERNIRQGIIRMEESNLAKVRIRSACLNIVNELERGENDSLASNGKLQNLNKKIEDKAPFDSEKGIKILFLAANPLKTTRLRLDEEINKIQQALDASNDSRKLYYAQDGL